MAGTPSVHSMINPIVPVFFVASLLPQTTGQQSPNAPPTPVVQPCPAPSTPKLPEGVKVKLPSKWQTLVQKQLAKVGGGGLISVDPNTVIKNATKPGPCTPPAPTAPPQ